VYSCAIDFILSKGKEMFIVSLEYIKDLSAAETYLSEHIAYLARYSQAGVSVMSGRNQPRTGDIILTTASGRAQVEKLIAEDPFQREGVVKYTLPEFIPPKVAEGTENYLATI
ncbi:YciI family protein, partial [Neisseria sp. P0021.S007]|uniref:YciI family protein n=1 Tax=Neisseria sp. P0021.S007 TaxID=3436822 RepID=UPI003F801B90